MDHMIFWPGLLFVLVAGTIVNWQWEKYVRRAIKRDAAAIFEELKKEQLKGQSID